MTKPWVVLAYFGYRQVLCRASGPPGASGWVVGEVLGRGVGQALREVLHAKRPEAPRDDKVSFLYLVKPGRYGVASFWDGVAVVVEFIGLAVPSNVVAGFDLVDRAIRKHEAAGRLC